MSNNTRAIGEAPARRLSEREVAVWGGFLRTHSKLIRTLDAELVDEHGLPLSSYEVLLYLANGPEEGMRMSELAESVLLSRSGLTRLADRLEKAGLIVRRECESDQRGLLAVITDEGRQTVEEARRTHLAGVRERFLSRISDAEQRMLGEIWERLLRPA